MHIWRACYGRCKSQAQFCSLLDANSKLLLKIDGVGHAYGSDMRRSCMSNAIDLQQWLAIGIKQTAEICNLFGMTSLALKVLQLVNVIATVVYSCKS